VKSISKLIFFVCLFVCFGVPEKTFFNVNIFNLATVNILQLSSFVLPLSYWFAAGRGYKVPIYLRISLVLFILYLFLSSLLKAIFISQSVSHLFFDYRINVVFIASALILILGNRIEFKKWFKFFLIAIFISYIFSLIFFFFDIGLQSSNSDDYYTVFRNGRLINGNKTFALLGLYFLFTRKNIVPFIGRGAYLFISVVSITSLIIALLNFERTLLALLIFAFIFLSWKFKKNLTTIMLPILVNLAVIVLVGSYAYKTNETVKNQVNRRFLSIFQSQDQIAEFNDNVWEGNRDFMIEGAIETFKKYPFFGTNINEPLFFYEDGRGAMQTDVTFINILARNGIVGLLLLLVVFFRLIKSLIKGRSNVLCVEEYIRSLLLFIVPLFLLYSLNHDDIYRGSVIIIIALLFNATNRIHSSGRLT
jgi:O-antigen ligase